MSPRSTDGGAARESFETATAGIADLLFKSPQGVTNAAQIEAFNDTWHWNEQTKAGGMKRTSQKSNPPEVSCQKIAVQKQTGPFNGRPLCFARNERTHAFC